jgi:hypothetical protein
VRGRKKRRRSGRAINADQAHLISPLLGRRNKGNKSRARKRIENVYILAVEGPLIFNYPPVPRSGLKEAIGRGVPMDSAMHN